MRVIAGSLGGRRLKAPAGRDTRPTSDRVREAMFAMLGDARRARVVLDLFAGTGALGIEALSRGAARAVFVERDAGALRVLQRESDALGIGRATPRCAARDALAALRSARERKETYDLVFIDPPYGAGAALGRRDCRRSCRRCCARARVVVESDRRAPLELDAARSTANAATATHRSQSTVTHDPIRKRDSRLPGLL